ncbi:carbohydrate sulfotransferase 4-like [Macrobrachium rosenbergii]|uniref:carbohydrate sulfotransferase 4-like n=1 Tax=Macrobrachium rosenbergii TaxID=79674 RepID=UPI0034D4FA75
MKGQRWKQTLLVIGISVAVFMYLVLAANYAPMIFMSFSKKVQPLQYAHLHPNSDTASQYYQEAESLKPPPKAVILWTTWRSGSTYLGELLANAVQDTFYSTEPLHYWRVKMLHENNTETSLARAFLQELLHCRVSRNFQKQIDYMSRQDFYMRWNTFFSRRCRPMRLCGKRKFVNHMCRRAHIHIVKVLRLSLKWAWAVLQDNGLDLKIIYVARDPRAVLVSRARVGWCLSDTCRKPEVVCSLLEEDIKQAEKLAQSFPEQFKFMQYEKISQNPEGSLRNIMSFLNMSTSESQLRLLSPASTDPDSLYSTRKDPRAQSGRWRTSAFYPTISIIQKSCANPIAMMGLQMFGSEEELRNLSIPLLINETFVVPLH